MRKLGDIHFFEARRCIEPLGRTLREGKFMLETDLPRKLEVWLQESRGRCFFLPLSVRM